MKKYLLIAAMLFALVSCNTRKYYSLGPLTDMVLVDTKDGRYIYDPGTDCLLTKADTAYVGMHQVLVTYKGDKTLYKLNGQFLVFLPEGNELYIFESGRGPFYVYSSPNGYGYKWKNSIGNEMFFIRNSELKLLLEKSTVMKDFPICRWISEEYYPSNL